MADVIARWGLDDFDDLYLVAQTFELPAAGGSQGFTLCFWFWAADHHRRQVIVQMGQAVETGVEASALFVRLPDHERRLPLAHPDWQHVALAGDEAGRLRVFLNGTEAAAVEAGVYPFTALTVGGYTDAAGGHFDYTFGRHGSGLIDDVRLYARALTAAEIAAFVPPTVPPPPAAFTADTRSGAAPVDIPFDASAVPAAKGGAAVYLWDFGDGERGTGQTITHRYAFAGEYTVRLRVLDEHHRQSAAEQTLRLGGLANPLRYVPVYINNTEGYACYRIPSIVRAMNGDLLAFAEARLESCSDSTGTIHIVCKRSADQGASWSPLTVVAAVPGFVNMNASPVVDEVYSTGRVVVVFRAADQSEWDIARGVGLSRAMCVTSDDHGATWSAPRDITAWVHRPFNPAYATICPAAALPDNQTHNWRIQIPAQGHAIQLCRAAHTRGRMFFAGSLTRGERSIFESENYTFWTDDCGDTWQMGGIIPRLGLNEAIAAELDNGDVLINTRAYTNGQPDGRRAITRAAFDERGFIHYSATIHDETLVDPAVQATLLRYTWSDQAEYGEKSRLLFANPAHPRARVHLTVRLSYDEGHTWAYSRVIERGPAAYSDLVALPGCGIGLLYERGNTGGLTFVRFTLDWLTGGEDGV